MNPKRILLVEDEKHIAEGIMINLKAEGFDALLAEDGESALKLYKSYRFDLIILDIMLPGRMDGLEVCKRIRNELGTEPILFLTARDSIEDKKQGLEHIPAPGVVECPEWGIGYVQFFGRGGRFQGLCGNEPAREISSYQ
jgi:CheY-like chemotaxis protein